MREAHFREWLHTLEAIDLDREPPALAAQTRELADVDATFVMRVNDRDDAGRFEPDVAGVGATFGSEIATFFGDGGTAALFTIDAPQPEQRNRMLALGATDQLLALTPRRIAELGFTPAQYARWCDEVLRVWPTWIRHNIARHHQLRMLICDGPAMIGYFNVLHETPLRHEQRRVVRRISMAVQRRIRLERRLGTAIRNANVLSASLEALPSPAFIVTHTGKLVTANRLGQAIAFEPDVRRKLADAVRGFEVGARVTRVQEAGGSPRFIVELSESLATRAMVSARARLSPREATVFRMVLLGRSQRAIAIALEISQRTVEHHVASLLAKLDAETVSQAIARLVS